ncbi:NAD-dependent epimerase/dehydratase family protein [Cyclobacterium sp. 1_MG-2023]|uniref:NAD-dependent epimerase/dehydratase family protein n=1 Tax=Cyclobacterium sp. 1_MG-2023 TaxID=3062681 RepID=UPI0026E1B2C9|nr:NAD-dependent epimerase/dehydratase family protein [Cyclobacterium sp. 1_MG-2023]MDO6440389.1 NAD-dependent epimerase/dehydratase family protein [Cyclobacterium sp. 1_MG-2023]
MKILILGGTGAMGVHLVELLSKNESYDIFVTSRSDKKSKETNINFCKGNARDIEFIRSLLQEKWDVIVDFMLYSTDMFEQRVDLFLNASNQYLYVSSARVYANNEGLINEQSLRLLDSITDQKYLSTDEYALSKARQENLLFKNILKNWTIIRPYITYNSDRLQLGVFEKEDWLYRSMKGRTIVFSEDIFKKFSTLTHGLDVAKGIASLIGDPSAHGEAFHITSNESKTWGEILNIYLDVLENKLGFRPKFMLQNMEEFLSHNHAKHQIIYDRIYDRMFNNNKISKYIEVNDFYSIKNGIENCIDLFLISPNFKRIDWVKEAIKDRSTKEHASISEMSNTKDKIRYFVYRYLIKKKL